MGFDELTETDIVCMLPVDVMVKPLRQMWDDTVKVKVVMRYDIKRPRRDLTVCNFNTVNSNAKDVGVVIVVDWGDGIYELTIKKNINKTPVKLDKGEYIDINIMDGYENSISFVSGLIRFYKK